MIPESHDIVESVFHIIKEVMTSVSPAQLVTKIVHEELVALLGGETREVDFKGRPAVVMMVVTRFDGS